MTTPTKTRYRVQPDEIVAAASATELVEYLTRTSKVQVASTAAFRVRAAHYRRLLSGATVRTHSDEVFVADMIAAGAYEVLPD